MMLLLTAAGGALGAVARYMVDGWVGSRGISRMPFGTLVVNVSGSFGLGLLVGLLGIAGLGGGDAAELAGMAGAAGGNGAAGGTGANGAAGALGGMGALGGIGSNEIMAFAGAGFLAAYTTFSTWMFEAARLLNRGARAAAALHVVGTVVLGVLAAAAGVAAGAIIAG